MHLLKANISPFEADATATTALHLATSANRVQACKLLVRAKASPLRIQHQGPARTLHNLCSAATRSAESSTRQ